ncbi:ATP phosphoribosyltransferase regulatory subunit [bacterium]|nr:ATP phosphoribosyltransferase regulatory subunit [bacterium]GIR28751.1 MAG: ATP phosphoribosyltransferase regulatory subunit [bacterium]|tara:strand:+ start:11315 stop:12523 length:1209 start_codon:yes stop_codon:yes gene_type:complete
MKSIPLPPGIRDYTAEIVRKFDYINEIFFQETESWGFNKIYTPIIENIESLTSDSAESDSKNILKLIDPLSGEILGIKSDITPQIARFVNSNYSLSNLPIRLSYAERVVRNKINKNSDSREFFQLGCESIGTEGILNDIEIIQLASSLIKKMGFSNQVITLSSSLIVNFILSKLKKSNEKIRDLFYKKNFSEIFKISNDVSVPKKERNFIKSIVIPFTKNKIPKDSYLPSNISKEIENLKIISGELIKINPETKCIIDFLDVKDFQYYSNITFEINVPKIKSTLLNGGRYNNLFNKYGSSIPAIGFGLNLLTLVKHIKVDDLARPTALIIIDSNASISESFQIRDFLVNQGFITRFSNKKLPNNFQQIIVKISKSKEINLYDSKMKKLAKFKSFKEFIEEEI